MVAQCNFEGDFNTASERQLQFINDVINELGYANSKVTFKPVGQAGDNFAANVKRLIIEGNNGNLSLIVKIAPSDEFMRRILNSFLMFQNEHVMYTEVLPKMVEIQKNAGVPKEEQLRFAKCYGSLSEPPNEVIVLEDLNASDFIMLNKFNPLSDECVRSVLKNFAILHSLSFALRYKEPETFDRFKAKFIDMWQVLAGITEVKMHFKTIEDDTLKILDDRERGILMRHKTSPTLDLASKFSKADVNNKYTIIQQGDSWTNNIMFRFEGDQVKDSVLIDYQGSKATSPVCDIMYMIFNCTDHETRMAKFNDWIDYYHLELDKSLSNFNLKASFVYSRDKLDADLKQYGKLQFGLAMVLASVLMRETADAAKIKEFMKSEDIMDNLQNAGILTLDDTFKTRYRKKVVGLIDSFTELGLF